MNSIDTAGNSIFALSVLAGLYCFTIGSVQILTHLAIKQEKVMLTGKSDVTYALLLAAGLYFVNFEKISPATQLFSIFLLARALSLLPYRDLFFLKYFYLLDREVMSYARLKRYFVPIATTFLANVQFRGLFYVTGVFYSSSVTGNLAMTHRIMQAPVNLVGASLRKAFFLEFTGASEKDITLHKNIKTVWIYGTLISLVIFPVFFFLVIRYNLFLPVEWELLPKLALAMYPPISLIVLLSWLDRLYDAFNKQSNAFYLELAYTIFLYAGIFVAVYTEMTPVNMMLVYSAVTTLYNLIWTLLSLRMIKMPATNILPVAIPHIIMLLITTAYL